MIPSPWRRVNAKFIIFVKIGKRMFLPRYFISILLCGLFTLSGPGTADARETEDNSFGGRLFLKASHDFKNGLYVSQCFKHDNYQFNRMRSFYSRTSVGYRVFPWLKVGVNYVPVLNSDRSWSHYAEIDLTGSLKSGNFNVSVRERYRRGLTGATNELRSRLKAAYSIPNSQFGIYLAPEVYTWGTEWKKTKHYVGFTYDILDFMQMECFYVYYTYRDRPEEHIIGMGLNFDL